MATTSQVQPMEQYEEKGLKPGALGLVSSVVMGVASTAPAYSLAATLFFVVAAVGLKSPAVAVLAFIPMLLCSIGYSEMNKADPDCGTTFTWGTRAFGPKTGWAGGWAIVAADILVMASLAQVAGQYVFLLFGAKGIGQVRPGPALAYAVLGGDHQAVPGGVDQHVRIRVGDDPDVPDGAIDAFDDQLLGRGPGGRHHLAYGEDAHRPVARSDLPGV